MVKMSKKLLASLVILVTMGVIAVISCVFVIQHEQTLDKLQAENRLPRIPEWVLLLVPFIGGGTGAVFGMLVFTSCFGGTIVRALGFFL